jgi:hypothetical protein
MFGPELLFIERCVRSADLPTQAKERLEWGTRRSLRAACYFERRKSIDSVVLTMAGLPLTR